MLKLIIGHTGINLLFLRRGRAKQILSLGGIAPLIRTYEIFGPKYSRVEIRDNSLEGAVYYLMSGHGGPDPGALGSYGRYTLAEDEYAYDVTLRLARRLIEHGALVYMITRDNNDGIRDQNILPRDKDERCYPSEPIPANQMARLRQRTNAVNRLNRKYRGQIPEACCASSR